MSYQSTTLAVTHLQEAQNGRMGLASLVLVPRKLLMLHMYKQGSRDLPLFCQKYNLLV